jgi:hypothetical protein
LAELSVIARAKIVVTASVVDFRICRSSVNQLLLRLLFDGALPFLLQQQSGEVPISSAPGRKGRFQTRQSYSLRGVFGFWHSGARPAC